MPNFWAEDECSFKNILNTSASNFLRMFLNITVSIGCAVVIYHSHKPIGSTNQPEVQTNRKHKPTGSTKNRKYKPNGSTNQPEAQTNWKHKQTGSTNQTEVQTNRKHKWALSLRRYPGRQGRNIIVNKKT